MITKPNIAYRIGFSSALNPNSFSGYNELSKWVFKGDKRLVRKMERRFLSGYSEGIKLVRAVKEDNLVASYNSRDRA